MKEFAPGSIKKLMVGYVMGTEEMTDEASFQTRISDLSIPTEHLFPKAGALCKIVTGEIIVKSMFGKMHDFIEVQFIDTSFIGLVLAFLLGEQDEILWADRQV